MTSSRNEPFFVRQSTKDLILELAEQDRLTVFAGAGVGLDRFRPSWSDLVRRLVERAGSAHQLSSEEASVFAQRIIDSHDEVGSATIAAQTLGPQLLGDELRAALYHTAQERPGDFLARAIATLHMTWREHGRDLPILTTNYDNSIENAFLSHDTLRTLLRARAIEVRPTVVDSLDAQDDTIFVHHLHGFVGPDGATLDPILLTEQDYWATFNTGQPDWRSLVLQKCLSRGPIVFIGSSLRDPNINRYLYAIHSDLVHREGDTGTRAYAIFGGRHLLWHSDSDTISDKLQLAAIRRLEALGIELVTTDYYGQIAQLLHEIAICRAVGSDAYFGPQSAYRYGRRLDRWEAEVAMRWRASPRDSYAAGRVEMCDRLHLARTEIARILSLRQASELLKIELWGRHPSRGELSMWASSDAGWSHEPSAHRDAIRADSPYVSVQTFVLGAAKLVPVARPSRWRFMMSVPIFLTSPTWQHLPVGVITLASSVDEARTRLLDPSENVHARVWDVLIRAGVSLLDPADEVDSAVAAASVLEGPRM